MAFNRPFQSNGRFNRGGGGNKFSRGGAQQQGQGDGELPDLRGIVWGNRFFNEQKAGAPTIQGYATVNGEKLRVAGWINPSPDNRENAEAQEYAQQVAAEINALLVEAQEAFGVAINLTFQNEEEWRAARDSAKRGGGGRNFSRGGGYGGGGSSAQPARNAPPRAQQRIPFDNQEEQYADPEPEGDVGSDEQEESPTPTRRRAATKPVAAKPATKPAARRTGRGGK